MFKHILPSLAIQNGHYLSQSARQALFFFLPVLVPTLQLRHRTFVRKKEKVCYDDEVTAISTGIVPSLYILISPACGIPK